MIDNITREDNIYISFSEATVAYTLVNVKKDEIKNNTKQIAFKIKESLSRSACTDHASRNLLSTGYTINHEYHDKFGNQVCTISISSADCGNVRLP